ncbi:MAG: hypothetical protein AB1817_05365 [Chloroflexota bacterium]
MTNSFCPPSSVVRRVLLAVYAHPDDELSAGGPLARAFQRLFANTETFMRAAPSEPPARIERDLFEGVKFD